MFFLFNLLQETFTNLKLIFPLSYYIVALCCESSCFQSKECQQDLAISDFWWPDDSSKVKAWEQLAKDADDGDGMLNYAEFKELVLCGQQQVWRAQITAKNS